MDLILFSSDSELMLICICNLIGGLLFDRNKSRLVPSSTFLFSFFKYTYVCVFKQMLVLPKARRGPQIPIELQAIVKHQAL